MHVHLEPEILHGGVAQVMLPEPPAGCRWRIEWRVVDGNDWHSVANDVAGGAHAVTHTRLPEQQHRIEWRAVAVFADAGPTCSVCGALGAVPQGYRDPELGDVALCELHCDRELDWA